MLIFLTPGWIQDRALRVKIAASVISLYGLKNSYYSVELNFRIVICYRHRVAETVSHVCVAAVNSCSLMLIIFNQLD